MVCGVLLCCDIVSSDSDVMITLFRHQWPGHPGEGGDRRDCHRHRPPPLHRQARGWLWLRGPVARWLRLPRPEEVIKWGLKLTPSDFVMYCTEHWGWVTSAEQADILLKRRWTAVATTHILKLNFSIPKVRNGNLLCVRGWDAWL